MWNRTLPELLKAFHAVSKRPEASVQFQTFRMEAFKRAVTVYNERARSLNVDAPPYDELAYGPLSGAAEIFKRAKRLVSILTPFRVEPLTESDINRALDLCVDTVNYLTWVYAMLKMATGLSGNPGSNDAPNYLGGETDDVRK
jgi:hypothetical protein